MRKIKRGNEEYVELPEDLRGKKIMLIRLEDGLYLLGEEEATKKMIERQVAYLIRKNKIPREGKKREGRIIKAPEEYWVFDTEQEAANFSYHHSMDIQTGEILGVRGFDGKFYAVRKSLYSYMLPKILSLLKEKPMTVEELSQSLKKDRNLIKAILELAREEGIVIEKSGGVYTYAG